MNRRPRQRNEHQVVPEVKAVGNPPIKPGQGRIQPSVDAALQPVKQMANDAGGGRALKNAQFIAPSLGAKEEQQWGPRKQPLRRTLVNGVEQRGADLGQQIPKVEQKQVAAEGPVKE